ncbi:DUF4450 domain-containing protein [Niabella yanshanensis]|uniref:DUF4450 domain-containing protein n=1 Tax=Niabella yanshanensis TaxID=577386 RepID=A0ABZ0W7T4_9BACT|nr:DUF4450 domain-containing protein [Niabella yanshanensis]WQD38080.1 DUF4450 domain-containing protein [Niabella yanshanensis]
MSLRLTYTSFLFTSALLTCFISTLSAQTSATLWHNKERTLHYKPEGYDFVLHSGTKKFNRALYGTNTGFRVEAGDLPEFAMYMPGMGGNCKIGITVNGKSKWISEAAHIKTVYRPGSMIYEIKDPLLNNGTLTIIVLALADADGMIIQTKSANTPASLSLVIAYGGATGKKFSRDGDIGADPESSFYLQPAYCKDNQYQLQKNNFRLYYGFTKPLSEDERYEIQYGKKQFDTAAKDKPKLISGFFPEHAVLRLADANRQENPIALTGSDARSTTPLVTASIKIPSNSVYYWVIESQDKKRKYSEAPILFTRAEAARKKIAERVTLHTPDDFINPLGSALAIAADAIWEEPSYMHGAIAWRMRLPAWRGAYAADALGWYDRARMHFDSYLKSQVTQIPPGPVTPDTTLHFARQLEKMGTSMFSNGYICRNPNGDVRPHHYDMNLVFMDQLLTHLQHTGDLTYVRKIWPALKLHLQWEKRNYDADGDGLYDAYACIWASDALQYSGGGVTHSSAYNYRANKMAAQLAKLLNENPGSFQEEANKIVTAMNEKLWAKDKGVFAEYKDLQGLQLLHSTPGLWTIYHAIDEGTATAAQQFRMLRYIDQTIPHIPVKAKDLPFDNMFLLSTTNWQPYTWSINNVALAENLHTSLAYWQSHENDNAFNLWKSSIVESMYLSSSPGGFQQLSFYDAVRGELYRDFADPVGVAARTLTEGLFGIHPDALNNRLKIQPGFPSHWKFAGLSLPNISFNFKEDGNISAYSITQSYNKLMNLSLRIPARRDKIKNIWINGKKATYNWVNDALHNPAIEIAAEQSAAYNIKVEWEGDLIEKSSNNHTAVESAPFQLLYKKAEIQSITDEEQSFKTIDNKPKIATLVGDQTGNHTVWISLQQGEAKWIQPITVNVNPAVEIRSTISGSNIQLQIINNSLSDKKGRILVNGHADAIAVKRGQITTHAVQESSLVTGTNKVVIQWEAGSASSANFLDWEVKSSGNYEAINLAGILNDNVINTFKHQYLSPRTAGVTLQIPWQGIGNWCYPLIQPEISDAGIKDKEQVNLGQIPFKLGTDKNIAYTSQWDNFPESVKLPLSGSASHAYLLMAGTTNHQQSQMINGIIYVHYQDGSKDSLELVNPVNWWPIEQDYMDDGFAFKSGPKPYRLIFRTGELTRDYNNYSSVKGFTNMGIEGGAGTVLDLPLNPGKKLSSLTLKTLTNEVVIGLMSLTLQRP